MAYVTPPTFVANDPLAAADLNILGDDIEYLKAITDGVGFMGTRVTRAANTSISTGTETAISFTLEAYDIGSWYTSGTNVIVPAAAIPAGFTTIAIMAVGSTAWHVDGTGRRQVAVLKNGTIVAGANTSADAAEDLFQVTPPAFEVVSASDVITLEVKQTSGGALNCYNSQLIVVRFAPVA